jgi:hypothetical protein
MLKALTLTLVLGLVGNQMTLTEIEYDIVKNVTTIRVPKTKLSGEKGRYHSMSFSIDYSYSGSPEKMTTPPERVNFELTSVVKARTLNTDLYVEFVVDGKPIHFSSNRSAIRRPVRGRPWIGEKMVFLIPREDFLKLAAAETLAIKMDEVTFEFSNDLRARVKQFAEGLKGSDRQAAIH